MTAPLIDRHGRVVRDLRISVTPRCNLACTYCDPLRAGHREPPGTITTGDVAHIVAAASALGMESLRFTGGEPLLRRDLPDMIRHAKGEAGLADVAITTNATLLERRLPELVAAGLDRVNVSLDAIDPSAFAAITGGGSVATVWRGIRAALDAGLRPLKLNAVVVRGLNELEVPRLASLAQDLPIHVRFIEYMHLDNAAPDRYRDAFVPTAEVRQRVEDAHGPLQPVSTDPHAPARLFAVPGWIGAIGFISPITVPFCGACSRMRVTSDARLRPCLLTDREFDLGPALRSEDPHAAIQDAFLVAAHRKPAQGHTLPVHRARTMVAIGG